MRIKWVERSEPCRSRTSWDREALVLESVFAYDEMEENPPELLRDAIDNRLGMQDHAVLSLGEMELVLRDSLRIEMVSVYTASEQWQKHELEPVPANVPAVYASIQATFDDNQRAYYPISFDIVYDERQHRQALVFHRPHGEAQWGWVADGVALCIDGRGALCEIHFFDISFS